MAAEELVGSPTSEAKGRGPGLAAQERRMSCFLCSKRGAPGIILTLQLSPQPPKAGTRAFAVMKKEEAMARVHSLFEERKRLAEEAALIEKRLDEAGKTAALWTKRVAEHGEEEDLTKSAEEFVANIIKKNDGEAAPKGQ
ncbi:hypothetical protein PG985_000174 [Apiospora marii]|uniref:Uncharacterized protein n=1 Tax=Apiospora marii TaxID=335849 RepID=A0ABR1R1E6_9PEZI